MALVLHAGGIKETPLPGMRGLDSNYILVVEYKGAFRKRYKTYYNRPFALKLVSTYYAGHKRLFYSTASLSDLVKCMIVPVK